MGRGGGTEERGTRKEEREKRNEKRGKKREEDKMVVSSGRGLRHNTRDCFSKARRKRGVIPETVFLRAYKVGDYVDVVCDPAQQKGMPFKYYHGKTGRVWNVTKRAVGVEMNKKVGGRIISKRLHVRIEHVRPSRCREEFLIRRERNDKMKKEAKARGEMIGSTLKRQPAGPKAGFTLTNVEIETVAPFPYDIVREGLKGF